MSLVICDWMANTDESDNEGWAEQQRNITSIMCGFANILATITNTTDAAQNLPTVQGEQDTDKNRQHC